MTIASAVPSRHHADPLDIRTDGPPQGRRSGSFGAEWIGGHSATAWWEYFIDSKSKEVYRVRCEDGVNGGNQAYTVQDDEWLHGAQWDIIRRCHSEVEAGETTVYISRNERAVMDSIVHVVWLETEKGKGDGVQSKEGLEGGLVGMCHGVPVICDMAREDQLPPRLTEQHVRLMREEEFKKLKELDD